MKSFEEYIQNRTVKRQSPNRNRAMSLLKESEEKRDFLELSLKNIPSDKMSPNFIVDYCYDILMETIRAKMFIDGYNAGNSHEAEVSYMKVLGFSDIDIEFMDELRYFRNGTKYYGTRLMKDYADKVLAFTNKNYSKLKDLIK